MSIVASVKEISRQLADSAMKFYDGEKPGATPGLLPIAGAFNWWEAGALFGQVCCRRHSLKYALLTPVRWWNTGNLNISLPLRFSLT